jgi:hypothetical protein
MHASKLGLGLLVCVAAASGCGDDSSSETDGAQPISDGSYPSAPCPTDLPPFTIGMEAIGEEGAVTGRLIDAQYAPPRIFNNDWSVELVDSTGAPLEDIEITRAWPYMPVHGHDGFNDPMVEALDEPGQFRVDSINLWMRGPWEVHLMVSSESVGDDHVVFEVCIE